MKTPNSGAYAEYLTTPVHMVFRIPEEMEFEEAATIGMGVVTAGQALYQTLKLPLPGKGSGEQENPKEKEVVVVHGAGTATGQFAVALAREWVLHHFPHYRSCEADVQLDRGSTCSQPLPPGQHPPSKH